jgi:hypothetical protein
MARSKKESLAQHVVGSAAVGLPEPAKRMVASRFGAPIALLLAVVLFGSGVVSLQWTNGRPDLEVDRERAREVRKDLRERAESVGVVRDGPFHGPKVLEPIDRIAERVEHVRDDIQRPSLEHLIPGLGGDQQVRGEPESPQPSGEGRFSRLLKYFQPKR